MTRTGISVVLLLALSSAGCGSKGAVSLSARIDGAELAVSSGALGADVTGGFDLVLELGDAASEATRVTRSTFAVRRGDTTLVEVLSLTPSEPFPIDVGVGESKTVRMTLTDAFVEQAEADAICEGDVWFTGTVTDTLSGSKPTPASSLEFAPTCP